MTACLTKIPKVTLIQEMTMTTKSKCVDHDAERDTHYLTILRFEMLKGKSFGTK